MSLPVILMETAAAYRRGLLPGLAAAGLQTDVPQDLTGPRIVLVPLRTPSDCPVVERVVADPEAIVVALIGAADADAYAHALGHGTASAVGWDADPDRIAAVALAAAQGLAGLPSEIARRLARRGPGFHLDRPLLEPGEVAWIVELSHGASVVALADRHGYSERAMFRRLGELYARLGASNRAEALVAAQRMGLLDTTTDRAD